MEMEFKDNSRRRTLVLVIGVLLAIGAGAAAFVLSSQSSTAPLTVPVREVVVAAADIPARTTVQATQLTLRTVPADASNAAAYTDPSLVVGKTTAVTIFQFQPITPNLLATGSSVGGVSILRPTETISPESPLWRAASVTVAAERAVGGLIGAGQRVDLFATLGVPVPETAEGEEPSGFIADSATKLVYSDLEVLQHDPEGTIYIFKVDVHQAEEIAHLQSLGAQFSLALRPDGDNREIDRSSYGETTTRILTQYNFPLPESLLIDGYPQPSPLPTPFPNEPYISPAPSASPEPSPGLEGEPAASPAG